jgi:hypothetical protein
VPSDVFALYPASPQLGKANQGGENRKRKKKKKKRKQKQEACG